VGVFVLQRADHPALGAAVLIAPWVRSLLLAALVGTVYFLAARLSLALLTKPDGVAVFWPAAGLAAGVLVGLGPAARLPVVIGIVGATIAANLLGDRNVWSSMVFAACNAGEAVLVARLIERFFDRQFSLDRLHRVLGFIAVAFIAAGVSGIGGTLGYIFFHAAAPPITIWGHWFASDAIGIIAVAPLVFELILTFRDWPSRREIIEGTLALAMITALSVIVIHFPTSPWALELTVAMLFPLLLWIAARCRPLFAVAAVFIFALTIVWTTTFEIGVFGSQDLSVEERIIAAQLSIVAQSLCALVLAALFAERRQNVLSLLRSEHQLREALAAAEDANRAKSTFLAAASHDLRQPLQTLDLLRATLKPRIRDSESRRLLGGIEKAVNVMNGMLISLLDINKLEAGSLRPSVTDFPVNELFDSLAADFFRPVAEKGLEWRMVRSAIWLRSDPRLLEEMLRNLLSNAVRYTDHGRILLGCRRIGDRGRIEVWDSGVGIAGDHIPKIFDEYYQVSVDAQLGGFGLGLAIVQRMARTLGHRVRVISTPGRGSGFSIEVPQGQMGFVDSPNSQPALPDRPLAGRALVIEDESSVRAAFASLLESYGLNVITAATVDDALASMADDGAVPDLILSDYNLPGNMNGIESIKALRSALGRNIPAIVVTGDIRESVLENIAAHDVGVAVKPVRADELRQLMTRLLP